MKNTDFRGVQNKVSWAFFLPSFVACLFTVHKYDFETFLF